MLDPDTNERIFNVVNLIEVCKACKKTDKPWKCTHMADRISGSKSQASRDQTLLFYRDGQQAVALRELFGEQSKNTSGLLPEPWIERFLKSEIHIKDPVRALYLAVDPGGGGPGELGIVGIVETLSVEYGARLAVRRSVCACVAQSWRRSVVLRISVIGVMFSRPDSVVGSTHCRSHASRRLSE